MTPLQEERLRELEQQAIDAFLDDSYFQVEEWLNKDDANTANSITCSMKKQIISAECMSHGNNMTTKTKFEIQKPLCQFLLSYEKAMYLTDSSTRISYEETQE
jgi:hypothetical protein